MRKVAILTVGLVLWVGVLLVSSVSAQVTGHWRSNSGGNYYIHQVGDRVYWLGESADGGATWTHVAMGAISGNQINLNWADVTKGRIRQSGSLTIRVEDPNHMVRVGATGGFGDTNWTRVGIPPAPPGVDLTGVWRGNDGGTYYIRQIGGQVFWLGESGDGGRSWTNIAIGSLSGDVLRLDWGDVTKGATRNHGRLVLRVDAPNHMVRTEVTGGFGGTEWRR